MMNASIDGQIQTKYKGQYTPIERPSWIEFNMRQAVEIAKRSPDGQTKHGCVITDMYNHPLASGYNAPAKGLPDKLIPNMRPGKYPFYIHAEINAIINASIPLWGISDGIRVYCTGKPCVPCLSCLQNCNLKEIYYLDGQAWSKEKEQELEFDFIVYHANIKLFPQDRTNYPLVQKDLA